MYLEHDVVVLRHHLPAQGLVTDDVGAVVGVYRAGGYEVEFTAADGDTVAVVTLAEGDIRPRRRREILQSAKLPQLLTAEPPRRSNRPVNRRAWDRGRDARPAPTRPSRGNVCGNEIPSNQGTPGDQRRIWRGQSALLRAMTL